MGSALQNYVTHVNTRHEGSWALPETKFSVSLGSSKHICEEQHCERSVNPGDTFKVPVLVSLSSPLQINPNPPPLYSRYYADRTRAWYTCIAQSCPHNLFMGVLEKEGMGVERDPFSTAFLRAKSKSSAMKTVSTWWRTGERRTHSNVWLNSRVLSGGSDQVDTRSFPRSAQRLPALRSDCFNPELYSSPRPVPAKTDSPQSTQD